MRPPHEQRNEVTDAAEDAYWEAHPGDRGTERLLAMQDQIAELQYAVDQLRVQVHALSRQKR